MLCFLGLALIGGEAPPPSYACNDGIDNDGDGFADYEDAECLLQLEYTLYCPLWDSETDPVPFTLTNEEMASLGCYEI